MLGLMVAALVGVLVGVLVGAMARGVPLRRSAAVAEPTIPPPQLAAPSIAEAELVTLRQLWQKRRHDVRGALSPGLLTADRLTGHEDDQVRRAAEIIVKSVQRAIDALADPTPKPPG